MKSRKHFTECNLDTTINAQGYMTLQYGLERNQPQSLYHTCIMLYIKIINFVIFLLYLILSCFIPFLLKMSYQH